jgi:hypothetical protein
MKTLNSKLDNEIFADFALSTEEMSHVRGGVNDPNPVPVQPPIKI